MHADALKEATVWWEQCVGGVPRASTVEAACKEYVANQRSEKGERAAEFSTGRFKLHVYDQPFGAISLDKLTTRDLERWRDGLVTEKRRKNSANRDFRSLKAALNFAFHRGMCPSDAAWRRVKPLRGEGARDGQRTAYLSPEQRRQLIAKAHADTADFLRALLYSAARPNEMQAACVSDFDPLQKTLRLVSLKGQGEERVRYVPLVGASADFFSGLTKGKLPKAPLVSFQRLPWARHLWAAGIRAALKAANEDIENPPDRLPPDVVAYSMRHCAITDMLRAGVDVSSVAKIAGTSITMINSHYAKFVATDVREKLSAITAF
jgi:integrase